MSPRRTPKDATGVQSADLSYLELVQEASPPLTERAPIWLRYGRVESGPPAASPQRHPCYEFGMMLGGEGIALVGREQTIRRPGGLLLAAPGIPHWIEITKYPLEFVTVFFLPSLLIDLGPESDGLKILRRFTAPQKIEDRLVHTERPVRTFIEKKLAEMVEEFERPQFGSEVRLRTLLLEMLVELIRWEQQTGRQHAGSELSGDWQLVHTALEFLRNNYQQPIYAQDLARATDLTEVQLKRLFRTTLGMPWGKYLQGYRIHRAAEMLSQTHAGVLETALAVGFETLSHFNATFRSFMGSSPREYRQKVNKLTVEEAPAPALRSSSRRAKNR